MDTLRFTRNLKATYYVMWEEWVGSGNSGPKDGALLVKTGT
jgi:hypothetical protein